MLLQNRGMEVNMDNDVALDRSREAQPLYIQIKNIVKEKIEKGGYLSGDMLPT